METKRSPSSCPECGSAPGDCYNLCPRSPAFYSPEAERADDANWNRADYLREAYGDPDLDAETETLYADMDDAEADGRPYVPQRPCPAPRSDFGTFATDDIPF